MFVVSDMNKITFSIQSIFYPPQSLPSIDLHHEQLLSCSSSIFTPSLTFHRQSSIITALQLDHVLENIAKYLDLHDLYSCTLVSYLWYTITNPYLWKQITISESRHDDDFLLTLNKNIGLLSSFKWEYSNWWEHHHVSREQTIVGSPIGTKHQQQQCHQNNEYSIASRDVNKSCRLPTSNNSNSSSNSNTLQNSNNNRLPSRTGLGRPTFRPPTQISFPTTSTIRNLGLEQARSLKNLTLDGTFDLVPLLETLVRSSSGLNTLYLKNINCLKREALPLDLFLRVAQNLEHFSLRTNALVTAPTISTSLNGLMELNHCDNSKGDQYTQFLPLALKSLDLDIRTLTGVHLMMILLRCPHLESFSMTEYGLVSSIEDIKGVLLLHQHFSQPSPGFDTQVITPHSSTSKVLENIPKIIPGGGNSSNNNNNGKECARFSDIALVILQHFCPRITSLDLKQAASGRVSSRTLLRYLCHNEKLVHLQARSIALMAEDMIDTSTGDLLLWKCKNLKSLTVAFGLSWPRDDEQLIHSDGGVVSRESCFMWGEKCVYKQLSLLTQLEVLDIPQSFLTMREGAGFEMLTTLTKIVSFSISGSRMDQAEKVPSTWFQQHWPNIYKVTIASRICILTVPPTSGVSSSISLMERRKSC